MIEQQLPWVWTDCKACGFKGSARSIKALVEAMAEHDRYCQDASHRMRDDDGKEDDEETASPPRSARADV